MPNKDLHHDTVIRTLKNSGWTILDEQLHIAIRTPDESTRRLFIDIKAESPKGTIALIEVKGLNRSPVHELMELVGQYIVYRGALDYMDDFTPLYVAITQEGYDTIIRHILGQQALKMVAIPLMIYDPEKEEIVRWIPQL